MKWSKPFILFLGGGLILFLPYLILGQGTAVPLADQLDSNHVWYILLKEHQAFLASPFTEIDGFLGIQYRLSYPAGLSVISALYFLLPPFLAFFLNKVLIYTIGFWGLWLLVKDQFGFSSYFAAWCALIWSTSFFYPFMGAGIAALPAILYSFQRIQTYRSAWYDWMIIAIYPFYAELVLVTLFVWIAALAVVVFGFLITKKANPLFLLSTALMFFLMMLKDYQLVLAFFTPSDFISHRTEFVFDGYIVNRVINPINTLARGEYTGIMYSPIIIGFTLVFLLVNLWKGRLKFATCISFSAAVLIALMAFLLSLPEIPQTIASIIPSLASLSLGRISNLVALGLFLAFFLASKEVSTSLRTIAFGMVLIFQIGLVNYEWRSFLKSFYPFPVAWSENPSYREVYSNSAYQKIKDILPTEYQGYIGHVNLPPAITAFHGLKTIDGYLANYKLESKHQIQKVIAAELEKQNHIKSLFSYWGNKAYLYHGTQLEWIYPFTDVFGSGISELDFNWEYLKSNLNTHYLISTEKITIDELHLVSDIKETNSCWDLYLYQIR